MAGVFVSFLRFLPDVAVATRAGNGTAAYFGDGGPATLACFSAPSGLASDGAGGVLVADSANAVVRRISANGVISLVAGTPLRTGASGDGGAASLAQLGVPKGSHPHQLYADAHCINKRPSPSAVYHQLLHATVPARLWLSMC